MGRLDLPSGSIVYLDAAPIIYSVEKRPPYDEVMAKVWSAVEHGQIEIVTSELTLLETLVHPVRDNDNDIAAAYETALNGSQMLLLPVTSEILRAAVGFRAIQNLKTPDAIHAATATLSGCTHLITNDPCFRRIEAIEVVVLSDLI